MMGRTTWITKTAVAQTTFGSSAMSGNYTMPLDTFGTAVTEPLMANLTVGPPVAGHVLVSWLGNPGVHLQTAASIVGATWQDHLDTASYSSPSGIYSTNYPMSAGPTFFRLVKP